MDVSPFSFSCLCAFTVTNFFGFRKQSTIQNALYRNHGVNNGDPFYVVKSEIQHAMKKVDEQYEEWRGIFSGTAHEGDLDWITNSVRSSLRSVEWDLQDLNESVSVVETNPSRFHLSTEEVLDRRRFVNETQARIHEVRKMLSQPAVEQKIRNQRKIGSVPNTGSAVIDIQSMNSKPLFPSGTASKRTPGAGTAKSSTGGGNFREEENDRFIHQEQQLQEATMQVQDEELQELGKSVLRIGDMGRHMNVELLRQGEVMEQLDSELDMTSSRFRSIQQRLNKLIEETGKGHFCLIIMLTVALVVLTLLVITT